MNVPQIALLVAFVIFLTVFIPTYEPPRVFRNVLTEEERRHIMDEATPKLRTSTVSMDGKVDAKVRNSETAWLDVQGDPVVNGVVRRCLQHVDRPIQNCERLQVLRYKPGGFYKPHQDAFHGMRNQRMYTFIMALNDGYAGGETRFPNLEKTYKLNAGDVLLFDCLNNYEFIPSAALHGGNPVKSGEKWICNLWVRKHPFGS